MIYAKLKVLPPDLEIGIDFLNGKTQLFNSKGVVKWAYFQKSGVFL